MFSQFLRSQGRRREQIGIEPKKVGKMSDNNQKRISRRKDVDRFARRPKQRIEGIDDEMILNYQRARLGAALPWDHERHAVHEVWAKLSNDIGPRESGRGIRSGF
jgi:hypothetical protein